MPHYMFCPRQKKYFQDFQNQRYIGIFMSQRDREKEKTGRARKRERERERGRAGKGKRKGTVNNP
jgi:hypothetical protein